MNCAGVLVTVCRSSAILVHEWLIYVMHVSTEASNNPRQPMRGNCCSAQASLVYHLAQAWADETCCGLL